MIKIYIPIWLDLLLLVQHFFFLARYHLHSNMVRFIITLSLLLVYSSNTFTFQYGQIYYFRCNYVHYISCEIYIPIWLDLLCIVKPLLSYSEYKFTFQYGQIYYTPYLACVCILHRHLHSNMVRFIIIIYSLIFLLK